MKKENSLNKKIYRSSTIKKITQKTNYLGSEAKMTPGQFLNLRLFSTIILFIALLFVKYGFILAPIIAVAYYIGLEYIVLDLRIKRRSDKLEYDALQFFEVLSLTLESGRNLKNSLEMTTSSVNGEMSNEFKRALEEIKLGKSLTEALNDMKYRIPSETVNNTILNISQSSTFGNSIVSSLNTQIDYLTDKKLQEVRSKISKLPVKLSAISVIFFLPIILLIILSPVIINLLVG